jgi:uncharacterized protein (TIGR00299 family) protein
MADIALIIDKSGITDRAKDLAKRIFYRLAVAEAKVHGTTPDKVYFHEVGAVDSIIDIAGVAVCIDILSLDAFYASVLHDGYGFVNCRHGKIPVPVPAVTELLAARGATFRQLDIEGELMTPTGAAIVTELAESFGPMPEMNIQKTVYGAGTKDFPVPDVLRLVLGEKTEDKSPANDIVTVIETNIDDSSPEILAYTMKRLMEAGARDVFFTPVYMKKNRPATLLSVICDTKDIHVMEQIIFAETSTIGLRKYNVERKLTEISTPYVTVKAKEIISGNESRLSPEYEDARRLALEKGVPLQEIYRNFREFS